MTQDQDIAAVLDGTEDGCIVTGDCLEVMKSMPDNCVDAVVTDPPAGIAFMGKEWDKAHGGRDGWIENMAKLAAEALRVAKPGARALVWALPRTSHWTATAWENAGWEVRDRLAHLFGQGFPKSLDVSKAIDKAAGAEREVTGQSASGTTAGMQLLGPSGIRGGQFDITAPTTDAAKEWEGWGTALKPACEDWWLLRKPLSEKTVAANVLKWGTGALNIDGCRIETADTYEYPNGPGGKSHHYSSKKRSSEVRPNPTAMHTKGRWPANVIHDGSEEVVGLFPVTKSGKPGVMRKGRNDSAAYGAESRPPGTPMTGIGDSGSAARFFYVAKAAQKERWIRLTCNCQTVKLGAWQRQDQNQSVPMDTTSHSKATSGAPLEAGSDSPTMLSGKKPTDPSPKDTASIMSTGTSRTTDSPTSGLFPTPHTSESTVAARSSRGHGGSPAASAANSSHLPANTSICRAKDGRCTGVVGPATSLRSWRRSGGAKLVCKRCGSEIEVSGHPTQKPIRLMAWLCRLVTPPDGIVLDPFCGSGSTCIAARDEGFQYIAVEKRQDYAEIARTRIAAPPEPDDTDTPTPASSPAGRLFEETE